MEISDLLLDSEKNLPGCGFSIFFCLVESPFLQIFKILTRQGPKQPSQFDTALSRRVELEDHQRSLAVSASQQFCDSVVIHAETSFYLPRSVWTFQVIILEGGDL